MPLTSNRWKDFTELRYPSGTDPGALKHRLTIALTRKLLSAPIFLNTKAVSVSSHQSTARQHPRGSFGAEEMGRERNTDRSKSWGWRSTERRRRGRAVTGSRDVGSIRQKSDAYRRLPAAGREGELQEERPRSPRRLESGCRSSRMGCRTAAEVTEHACRYRGAANFWKRSLTPRGVEQRAAGLSEKRPIVQRDGVSPRQTHPYVHRAPRRAPRRAPSKQGRNEAFPHSLHTLVSKQLRL
ncbi:uncharacterized protein [Excalfactoria chinensis]|uniref:uncharacterized protein n=1 Tax=Excalfactoria chinensis TaxID=46218 RepID=UPI003B3A0F33